MMKYEVVTRGRVFAEHGDSETWAIELWEEQEEFLFGLGIQWHSEIFCHFLESAFRSETAGFYSLHEALESLASKEGFDLVRFSNGNYGFVAYYGSLIDALEIVTDSTEIENLLNRFCF